MYMYARKTIFLILTISMVIFSVSTVFARENVNWESATVTVMGMGIAPPTAVNQAQARMLARRAAVADGYRQLAESINGVNVDAESTVENMMVLNDVIKTKVSAVIKGAQVISEKITSDGGYEVTMQVPMYGVTNSLAGAVFPLPTIRQPFPELVPNVEPSVPTTTTNITVNINVSTTVGS